MKGVSIIIPVYNEENNISKTIRKVKKNMDNEKIPYEIIVVNDGSTDNTTKNASRTSAKLINHPYNKGYGAALKTGILQSKYNYVMFFDADAEHNASDITRLLKYINNFDMVVGARPKLKNFRMLGKIILEPFASYIAGIKIPDINSGFRIIKKDIVKEFMDILPNSFSFTTTITLAALKTGYTVKYVPISIGKRVGKSKIKPLKDGIKFLIYLLRMCMLFNPLKVFLPVSILIFLVGLILLSYGIILEQNVSDSSILFLLSGIQIFFFGLIADQTSVKKRMK
ncbi:MAG: glycosyltransferase family 2 protein [Promethearchaeota archaeon]